MRVKDWISYDKSEDYDDNRIGGMGGWFNGHFMHEKDEEKRKATPDHTWEDYLAQYSDEQKPYVIALKEAILEGDIRLTGAGHQTDERGVPLFEDDTVATYSYRAWGDLMAAVYTTKEKPLDYMEYYM